MFIAIGSPVFVIVMVLLFLLLGKYSLSVLLNGVSFFFITIFIGGFLLPFLIPKPPKIKDKPKKIHEYIFKNYKTNFGDSIVVSDDTYECILSQKIIDTIFEKTMLKVKHKRYVKSMGVKYSYSKKYLIVTVNYDEVYCGDRVRDDEHYQFKSEDFSFVEKY